MIFIYIGCIYLLFIYLICAMFAAEYWPGCRITLNTENKNAIIIIN